MATEDLDTDRATVSTYVPAYQKQRWADHADRLGMSQSEFVRTMVQAGRREFAVEGAEIESETAEIEGRKDPSRTSNPRGEAFEDRVVETLSGAGYLSWDELVASLTDNIEGRLDETLQELQADNVVQYSGRHGGYSLAAEGRE
jgi:hypothetical protein